ncbi:hypothetical protein VTH82DRAFT_1513 [Thermothelomyces myriococcoides]
MGEPQTACKLSGVCLIQGQVPEGEAIVLERPGRRRADSTAGTKSPISSGSPCGYTSAANSTSGTVSGSVSASTPRSVPNPDVNWTWNGNTLHLLPPGSRSYARPEMITPSRMSNNDLNNPTSNLLADTMPVSNVPGMHSLLTDLDSNGLAYFTHGIGEMDFVTPAINSPIDSSMPVAGGDSGNAQLQINDASLLIPDDNTDHQGSSTGSDPHL